MQALGSCVPKSAAQARCTQQSHRCRAPAARTRCAPVVATADAMSALSEKLADTPTVTLRHAAPRCGVLPVDTLTVLFPFPASPGVAPLLPSAAGVYAIFNAAGELQYVGMSRKVRVLSGTASHVLWDD